MSKTADMTIYHREWRRKQKIEERKNKQVDGNSVCCHVCNQVIGIKGLPIHLRMHGISKEEYIKEHLDDFKKFGWKICPICGVNLTNKETCSRKCGYRRRGEKFSGENSAWYGRKHTQESVDKMSQSRKGKGGISGDNNPSKRLEVRAKISATQKANAQRPDYVNPMYGKTHTSESIQKIIKKRSKTSIEHLAAQLMDKFDIQYHWQFFLKNDGKTYAYDFKIKGKSVLIEIDGDYWHGGPSCKKHFYMLEQVQKNDKLKDEIAKEKGYQIIRIWGSEMRFRPELLIMRIENATVGL